jgi:hypothetical protein
MVATILNAAREHQLRGGIAIFVAKFCLGWLLCEACTFPMIALIARIPVSHLAVPFVVFWAFSVPAALLIQHGASLPSKEKRAIWFSSVFFTGCVSSLLIAAYFGREMNFLPRWSFTVYLVTGALGSFIATLIVYRRVCRKSS